MLYNVYCDETCHLENDGINVMVLGAVWCPQSKLKEVNQRIKAFRMLCPNGTISTEIISNEDGMVIMKASILDEQNYMDLQDRLNIIRQANGVESIYLIYVDPQERKSVYLVDGSLKPCSPGQFDPLYESNEHVLTDPASGFPAYVTNTPEYGWLVSAGAPLYDEENQVFLNRLTKLYRHQSYFNMLSYHFIDIIFSNPVFCSRFESA